MSRLAERLPTLEQIRAITDVDSLECIRSDIDFDAERIATQIEFPNNDSSEWMDRARNALALHRHLSRQIGRRVGLLREADAYAARHRPDDVNDPLTNEVLAEWPQIDVDGLTNLQAVDDATAWLVARIDAINRDRDEEISLEEHERDCGFLAQTKNAAKAMAQLRQRLQVRRGQLTKAARQAAHAAVSRTREELFVMAVKEIVDRDTFLSLWARVDVLEAQKAAA